MGEIPLGVRAGAFMRRLEERVIQLPPQQVLTPEEQERLSGEATQLLKRLVGLARPSLLTEEIDQREKRRVTANYLTPFIPVVEEGEDPKQALAFAIAVETSRYCDLMAAGTEQGEIGSEEVSAMVLLRVPGYEEPLPIFELKGREISVGELACTEIAAADSFFMIAEDEEKKPSDRFDQIRKTSEILDKIGPVLEGGVQNSFTCNGQEGHILIVIDWRHGKQQMFIPHAKPAAA